MNSSTFKMWWKFWKNSPWWLKIADALFDLAIISAIVYGIYLFV